MKDENLIDRLGGTSKVAEMCEVTTGAVSQWRKNGIPGYRLQYFKAARPELFTDSCKTQEQVAA